MWYKVHGMTRLKFTIRRIVLILPNLYVRFYTLLRIPVSKNPPMSLGQWDQHAENTVIIGGGVVGLSTAYYLALLQQSNASGHSAANSAICIVESSTKVGLGASGQATGNLGDSGFVSAAEELGSASFALHHELAYQNNGPTAYGYAPLTIWTASREASKPCSGTNDSPGQVRNPPRWLKRAPDWNFSVKTNQSHASHLLVSSAPPFGRP